jgi:hypothetical protein
MGRLRRVESRAGRIALMIGGFLLAVLVACVPVGVLGSSNILWGEGDQYGHVDVPGTKVLHLPGRTIDVDAAVEIPGRGNETPDVPLPSGLSLTVSPVRGSDLPVVTRDLGDSSNANGEDVNAKRRVWRLEVPREGDYRVTTRGDFLGVGVNSQLWFGHGPPLPGQFVPLVAAVLVLLIWFLRAVVGPRLRRRPSTPAHAHAPVVAPLRHRVADAPSDAVSRLERLAELHDRGALTDAEFTAEKAKLIDSS